MIVGKISIPANRLENILEHYGGQKQQLKCIEECSELINAICDIQLSDKNSLREEDYDQLEYSVQEEIADVLIMAGQLAILLGEDDVQRIIDYKLKRTLDKIADDRAR